MPAPIPRVCACACACAWVCVVHVCVCIRMCVCMRMCMCICMCMCMCRSESCLLSSVSFSLVSILGSRLRMTEILPWTWRRKTQVLMPFGHRQASHPQAKWAEEEGPRERGSGQPSSGQHRGPWPGLRLGVTRNPSRQLDPPIHPQLPGAGPAPARVFRRHCHFPWWLTPPLHRSRGLGSGLDSSRDQWA